MSLRDQTKRVPLSVRDVNVLHKEGKQSIKNDSKVDKKSHSSNYKEDLFMKFMSNATIYIDSTIPESNARKLASMFAVLGTTRSSFFNEKVDIIVSRRKYDKTIKYPSNDIFCKVDGLTLRVWTYEKAINLLLNAGVTLKDLSRTTSTSLSALLQNEKEATKVNGIVNSRASHNNLENFKHFYIYAYDLTGKYSPILVKEWQKKLTWPILSGNGKGRSPFSPIEHSSDSRVRNLQKAQQQKQFDETKEERQKLRDMCKINPNDLTLDNNIFAYVNLEETPHVHDSSSPIKITSSNNNGTTDNFSKDSSIPPTEITPSGVPQTLTGLTTLTTMSNAKTTSNPDRRMSRFFQNNKTLKRRIINEHPIINTKKAKVEKQPSNTKRRCECCEVLFTDYYSHVRSQKHIEFARNDRNYEQVDSFIEELHNLA